MIQTNYYYQKKEVVDKSGNLEIEKVYYKGQYYTVTAIGKNAAANNKNIKMVTLGKGVTKVDKKSFFKAKNLKKITLKGNTKFAKNSLQKTNKKLKIVVPSKEVKKSVSKQLKKAGNVNAKVKVK